MDAVLGTHIAHVASTLFFHRHDINEPMMGARVGFADFLDHRPSGFEGDKISDQIGLDHDLAVARSIKRCVAESNRVYRLKPRSPIQLDDALGQQIRMTLLLLRVFEQLSLDRTIPSMTPRSKGLLLRKLYPGLSPARQMASR